MNDLKITAWRKYGRDRLYANLPDGTAIAYLDRLTGETTVLRPEYRVAAQEAFAKYLAAEDPRAGPPPPPRREPHPLPELALHEDLALNHPGASLRALLAASGPGPLERTLDRLLGRPSAWESWRVGLAGEKRVGRELHRLARNGWRVLHSIPLPGKSGVVDIDHLLIGPGGVFSINTKHHHKKEVWIGDDAVKINHGRPQPYARKARAEAKRVQAVLERFCDFQVPVTPTLVFVGVTRLDKVATQLDVRVYEEREVSALGPVTGVLSPAQVDQLYEIARRRGVWAGA